VHGLRLVSDLIMINVEHGAIASVFASDNDDGNGNISIPLKLMIVTELQAKTVASYLKLGNMLTVT